MRRRVRGLILFDLCIDVLHMSCVTYLLCFCMCVSLCVCRVSGKAWRLCHRASGAVVALEDLLGGGKDVVACVDTSKAVDEGTLIYIYIHL